MSGRSLCFVALPGASPAAWAEDEARAGDVVLARTVTLVGPAEGEAPLETQARIVAPRLLPRLFRNPGQRGTKADAAIANADRVVFLLPIGRYDDGVWAPIVERILQALQESAARPREIVLAWTGLDPFLAPFGRRRDEIWHDPRLVPNLLAVLERQARSLAAVLRGFTEGGPLAIRCGLIRFEPAEAGHPVRATLALA